MKVNVKLIREGRTPTFRIKDARGAFEFLRGLARGLDREHFWRLDLDSRGGFLGYEVVSIGSLDASIVHAREVFKGAFLTTRTTSSSPTTILLRTPRRARMTAS